MLEHDKNFDDMKSVEDFFEFMNKEYFGLIEPINCEYPQPIDFKIGYMGMGFVKKKIISICRIYLILRNHGPNVLEDYKLYLEFENVLNLDSTQINGHYTLSCVYSLQKKRFSI